MPYQNVVALDLEMNQPSGRIIQIGACVGDIGNNKIVESFSVVVEPGEPVSEEIQILTGITQQRMDEEGVPLQQAGAQLFEFLGRHKTFGNPVVWGIGDAEALRDQLGLKGVRWPFGYRSVDIKTIHVAMCLSRGMNTKGGLSKTMKEHYSMDFIGRPHDARCDAENTMLLFFTMRERYFILR